MIQLVRRSLSAASTVLIRLIVLTFFSRGQLAVKSRHPGDAAAAAAAAQYGSDKFTARLKPSELMKLGHPLNGQAQLPRPPSPHSSRVNKKSPRPSAAEKRGMDRI